MRALLIWAVSSAVENCLYMAGVNWFDPSTAHQINQRLTAPWCRFRSGTEKYEISALQTKLGVIALDKGLRTARNVFGDATTGPVEEVRLGSRQSLGRI